MIKNQILITIDSLRYDVFEAANLPWLKSFKYYKANTLGLYTLPSHTSIFAGRFPTTTHGEFDYAAKYGGRIAEGKQPWKLVVPGKESSDLDIGYNAEESIYLLDGKDIVEGFKNIGFNTIGAASVKWFDNGQNGAYVSAIDSFDNFSYTPHPSGMDQLFYISQHLDRGGNNFIFINFGETHHPFNDKRTSEKVDYGNFAECFNAQVKAVETIETYIKRLYDTLNYCDMYIMSDHGECLGEDGLWGHTFFHEKVIEVPIMRISK